MKNFPFYLLVLVMLTSLAISCSDDDESGPSYNFEDQNLQGKIDGEDFILGDGRGEISFFEDDQLSIDLYHSDEPEDACDVLNSDFVYAFFTIPDEVGIYELFLDLENFEGQTVTLFNPDGTLNNIATEGAVELTSITDTEVSGRIDARMDDDNFINGNFTVEFCPEN